MIAFIKGTVDSLSEGKMILESHGIGYELNIPASMFDAGVREGEELKIYTHMSVREDGISLFGFLSREDLEIYRMLIGVSGIGPKAALAVLSTLTADNLRFAVLSEDVQAIAKTPGIGKWEEDAVEHSEVQVGCIQYKLDGNLQSLLLLTRRACSKLVQDIKK